MQSPVQSDDVAWSRVSCLKTLADAALALGESERAINYLYEALAVTKEWHFMPLQLELLLNYADLFLHQGDEKQAALYLGLVFQHPASMFETKVVAQYKLSVLAQETREEGLERGKVLELEGVVKELVELAL